MVLGNIKAEAEVIVKIEIEGQIPHKESMRIIKISKKRKEVNQSQNQDQHHSRNHQPANLMAATGNKKKIIKKTRRFNKCRLLFNKESREGK